VATAATAAIAAIAAMVAIAAVLVVPAAASAQTGAPDGTPEEMTIPGAFDLPWWGELPERVPAPDTVFAEPFEDGAVVEVDLDAAIAGALARNPALKAIEEQIDEVTGGIDEARADALPQLALVASYSQSRNPSFLNSPDFESILEQFPGGSFEPSIQKLWSVAAEVNQPIYTFGKLGSANELARLAGSVVSAQIQAARLETALLAAEAYYDVLAARRALGVIEAQDRARRASLRVTRDRYDIGEATRLELLRAQSQLDELGPTIAALGGDVTVAESRLRQVMGLPPGVDLEVVGAPQVAALVPTVPAPGEAPAIEGERETETEMEEVPTDSAEVIEALRQSALRSSPGFATPPPLPQLLELARRQRPEVDDLLTQQEALRLQQEIVAAEGRPQIEFNGRYGRQVREIENVSDPLYADWAVSIGMRWEFFDGGRRRGQIAQLESQRQQRAWELRDLENQIVLQIETALAGYRAAVARESSARTSAETAREATRVAQESFNEGVVLQSDVLDAQEREIEAEIQLVDAIYQAYTERARLARAVGLSPSSDLDLFESRAKPPTSEDLNESTDPNDPITPNSEPVDLP
jgi:outer membrane protein TolC